MNSPHTKRSFFDTTAGAATVGLITTALAFAGITAMMGYFAFSGGATASFMEAWGVFANPLSNGVSMSALIGSGLAGVMSGLTQAKNTKDKLAYQDTAQHERATRTIGVTEPELAFAKQADMGLSESLTQGKSETHFRDMVSEIDGPDTGINR
ncbi:MAG: hypothetical protein MRY32_03745 [Rickettsiales bacterium]|nr:hypothetical protein [Rickettsiales bacterium]